MSTLRKLYDAFRQGQDNLDTVRDLFDELSQEGAMRVEGNTVHYTSRSFPNLELVVLGGGGSLPDGFNYQVTRTQDRRITVTVFPPIHYGASSRGTGWW